ncbi:sigma-54-dependent Fis family transcriptional regulator [Ottowia sp. GY511]|uniref:Sigma-54-dependent transcriptional regulator n=1 Tax=Ottowia flava TaxID=2675430 RepID=A0ABW4KY56_9BURK|nr:sigma-54 dependent transcriptional regulator [Ottowia sp. GY511]TXK31353.1 sigma-54-dependent Fis family transcriptional regulator [Ottowia sp. GY511]
MTASPPNPVGARILVVDDEPDLRTLYELTLLREGHEVHAAGTVAEARDELAAQSFDIVITDMRLPDGLGLDLLRELVAQQRTERCIVITAYGSAENAVEALKCGAFDYLTKPVDLRQFRSVVASAFQTPGRLPAPAAKTTGEPVTPDDPTRSTTPPADRRNSPSSDAGLQAPGAQALARMVGESPAMRSVKHRIAKVARSMAPVLVHGESGTGKELAAQAVHANSHRHAGPFVPVNCGAIPENLLEAEFFGARKGSYTGAATDRQGFFQAARGGTLFLDEIGDLPLAMQAKLLRAIQERRVRPLGETQEEAVDVRIVSATHKDLAAEVQAGRFRQDLYYRLNVIEVVVPPLRERREDLPALCEALLARIPGDGSGAPHRLTERQMTDILAAPLDGNVRELENLLHRAVALGEAGDSGFGELPLFDSAPAAIADDPATSREVGETSAPSAAMSPTQDTLPEDLERWLDAQERRVLVRALDETGFNRTAAAALLGLNLRQIRYRMSRLGITEPGSDEPADGDR